MPDTPPSPVPQILDEDAPLCPVCGYDLRGTTGERCSECGGAIDWEALKTSGFPWARRKEIGQARAYVKTVWLVTLGSKRLDNEASRPQEIKDARAFSRRTTVILAAVFLLNFAYLVVQAKGLGFLAIRPAPYLAPIGGLRSWLQDVVVPWSAGATIPVTFPTMLILLAAYLTAAPQVLLRVKGISPARQERLTAIGLYATAPLAWLLPSLMIGALALLPKWPYGARTSLMILGVSWFIAMVALFLAAARVVFWAARVRHQGLERKALAMVQLLGIWLLGLFISLGFLPWCIGFLWIVIDSFL